MKLTNNGNHWLAERQVGYATIMCSGDTAAQAMRLLAETLQNMRKNGYE